MKVIALSALVLSTVAITSLAMPIFSMAQPVQLSDAELDRITAGKAIDLSIASLTPQLPAGICPTCQDGVPPKPKGPGVGPPEPIHPEALSGALSEVLQTIRELAVTPELLHN
jgi:hypothetical protein